MSAFDHGIDAIGYETDLVQLPPRGKRHALDRAFARIYFRSYGPSFCYWCAGGFISLHGRQQYCGAICRKAALRMHKRIDQRHRRAKEGMQ